MAICQGCGLDHEKHNEEAREQARFVRKHMTQALHDQKIQPAIAIAALLPIALGAAVEMGIGEEEVLEIVRDGYRRLNASPLAAVMKLVNSLRR